MQIDLTYCFLQWRKKIYFGILSHHIIYQPFIYEEIMLIAQNVLKRIHRGCIHIYTENEHSYNKHKIHTVNKRPA